MPFQLDVTTPWPNSGRFWSGGSSTPVPAISTTVSTMSEDQLTVLDTPELCSPRSMCSSLETESAPSTPRTHCSADDGPFSCATSPEPESDEYDEWSSELSDALSYTSYSSYSSESSSASSSSAWSYASSLASVQVSDSASEDVDPSGPSGETGLSPRVVGIDLCEGSSPAVGQSQDYNNKTLVSMRPPLSSYSGDYNHAGSSRDAVHFQQPQYHHPLLSKTSHHALPLTGARPSPITPRLAPTANTHIHRAIVIPPRDGTPATPTAPAHRLVLVPRPVRDELERGRTFTVRSPDGMQYRLSASGPVAVVTAPLRRGEEVLARGGAEMLVVGSQPTCGPPPVARPASLPATPPQLAAATSMDGSIPRSTSEPPTSGVDLDQLFRKHVSAAYVPSETRETTYRLRGAARRATKAHARLEHSLRVAAARARSSQSRSRSRSTSPRVTVGDDGVDVDLA